MQAATCLEPLLFKAVKGAFGGQVRFIVSGGAPLTTYVQEFLQATMSTPIIQVRTLRSSAPENIHANLIHTTHH